MGYQFYSGDNNEFGNERIDPNAIRNQKMETDVFGLTTDDVYIKGSVKFPIFDVNKDEFFKNMEGQRSRLRFNSEGKVAKYMRMSRYSQPFYIRFTDENGKQFLRKVK